MTDADLKNIILKVANDKFEVFVGKQADRNTYVLDSAAKPKGMTITSVEGPNQGKTFPAIYEIDGDTLRICYDLSGTKRPAKFETTAGTLLCLATYHRKKE